jgi:hypothetical protein
MKRVAALGLFMALLAPSGAEATFTIGSNLGRPPSTGIGCPSTCTLASASLAANAIASSGLTSPVNGKIVTWRIRTGSSNGPVAFRVIRRASDGSATGAGTVAEVTPPTMTTTPYPADLPIAIGDTIGVDVGASGSGFVLVNGTGTIDRWSPALPDGGPFQPRVGTNSFELALNADIEPTSAFTIGAIKPGKGGKLTVTATLPNPGTLEGGDKNDSSLATVAGKKKSKYLQHATMPVGVAGQTVRLLLKPTKLARSVLAENGRLKTKAKVVFTPTGGNPSTQTLKVKLKK